MGQRVNPISLRLGISRDWDSIWWNWKNLKFWVIEDEKIRQFIFKKFRKSDVARVMIFRNLNFLKITIFTAKPAFLIGQKGKEIDALEKSLLKLSANKDVRIDLRIEEIKRANTYAQLIAINLALRLEKNVSHKRLMKKAIKDALQDGVKGIKIKLSGRLGGAEMARSEWYSEGRVPTQTFRSDVDYASEAAFSKYGAIGVKVWLYRGDIMDRKAFFSRNYLKTSSAHIQNQRKLNHSEV